VILTGDERTFVENMGRHMMGYGLARTTGRVYAYLLLRPEPATLDQIAKDLQVAKSGASVATRQLVGFGMAKAYGSRGSRLLRYDAIYDLQGVVAAREAQTRAFIADLREGARVAASARVRRKMVAMTAAVADVVAHVTALAERRGRKGKRP
jgi:DNA-binding transcriptional regulator GbsR (MarR family)